MYSVRDSPLCLTGTAEVPLAAVAMDAVLSEGELPLRLAAFGHCFRTEAGAAGAALPAVRVSSGLRFWASPAGSMSCGPLRPCTVVSIRRMNAALKETDKDREKERRFVEHALPQTGTLHRASDHSLK